MRHVVRGVNASFVDSIEWHTAIAQNTALVDSTMWPIGRGVNASLVDSIERPITVARDTAQGDSTMRHISKNASLVDFID